MGKLLVWLVSMLSARGWCVQFPGVSVQELQGVQVQVARHEGLQGIIAQLQQQLQHAAQHLKVSDSRNNNAP